MAGTVSTHTLGCKLNFSETSTLARQLEQAGYIPVPFSEPADVVLINTCSVTEQADAKARHAVRQALRLNPNAFVAVVGCYAQLKPQEIAAIPGVSAVLGAAEKFRLLELLPGLQRQPQAVVHRQEMHQQQRFEASWSRDERTRAFLKLQDGCDYKCSFCTIPLARGQSRSASPAQVLQQVHQLLDAGVPEIVLTGINLGDYHHADTDLLGLLRQLVRRVQPPVRLRLSSIEPNLLSDALIDFVAEAEVLMPHFHIPLQSGSDAVLASMRRRYRTRLYAQRIERIRRAMPLAGIGADVIVGYPTETDAHFDETREFLANLGVSYLHVFPFSARENTPAALLKPSFGPGTREERAAELRQLGKRLWQQFAQSNLGLTRSVLWEQETEDGMLNGLTDNYLRVRAALPAGWGGKVQAIRLQQVQGSCLLGEPLPVGALA